jgi:hypothetical protein
MPVNPQGALPPFVTPSNISGTVNSAGIIRGLSDSPIRGLTFENCHLAAQRGLMLVNVTNVDFSGLHLEVKTGEALIPRTTAGKQE